MRANAFRGLLFSFFLSVTACGTTVQQRPVNAAPQAMTPPAAVVGRTPPPATRLVVNSFPDSIATFVHTNTLNYSQEAADPGLGYSLTYRNPTGVTVSLYIYDDNKPNIADGHQSVQVRELLEKTTTEIRLAERLGAYRSVEQLGDSEVAIGAPQQGLKALARKFRYVVGGHEAMSHVYVTGYRKDFVKIRASYKYDPDNEAACALAIQQFLFELGPQLNH